MQYFHEVLQNVRSDLRQAGQSTTLGYVSARTNNAMTLCILVGNEYREHHCLADRGKSQALKKGNVFGYDSRGRLYVLTDYHKKHKPKILDQINERRSELIEKKFSPERALTAEEEKELTALQSCVVDIFRGSAQYPLPPLPKVNKSN